MGKLNLSIAIRAPLSRFAAPTTQLSASEFEEITAVGAKASRGGTATSLTREQHQISKLGEDTSSQTSNKDNCQNWSTFLQTVLDPPMTNKGFDEIFLNHLRRFYQFKFDSRTKRKYS